MPDYALDAWTSAVRIEFERRHAAAEEGATAEVLDIEPAPTSEGVPLLRVAIWDLVADRPAGRATAALEIRPAR